MPKIGLTIVATTYTDPETALTISLASRSSLFFGVLSRRHRRPLAVLAPQWPGAANGHGEHWRISSGPGRAARRGLGGLLAGLLVLASGAARAQSPPRPALTTADGLADNTVQSLTQDRQGFLWLGTQDGLSRFDGRTFRTYRADARHRGSLTGNFVRALAPAPQGGLWLGTDYGLSYYDPATERFARVPADTAAPYFVNALLADPTGPVWVGTEDGLLGYDPRTRRLRRFRCAAPGAAASAGRRNSVRCLARDAAGTLWAGTGEGQLCRLDLADGWLHPTPAYRPAGPAPLSALAAGPAGGLWAGTEDGGLYFLPPAGPARELAPSHSGGVAVRSLWVDARGGAWVGSGTGLRYWLAPPAPASGLMLTAAHTAAPAPTPTALAADVLALAPGREGQLWVGTAAGLRWLDLRPSAFGRLPVGPGAGPVWAVAAGPTGLWLGTEQQGLLRLAADGRVLERQQHRPADTTSLADNYLRCVLADPDGGLWVGTQRRGLDYRPAGAAGWRHFRHAAGRAGSLADDFVRCLYRDPLDGALWVGTEGGLCRRAAGGAGGFRAYQHRPDAPHGLPNNFVRCVLRDAAGRLWVGTGGGGLSRLDDPATGRFTTFRANAAAEHGLPGNFVRALCLDATGRLWVGTEDGGLCRLDDPATGRFTTFGEAQGLPNSVIYSILLDSATRSLWVSTNRGVARLDPATERLTAFDAQDGLPQLEYNAGAGCRGPGGRLYFGGRWGQWGFGRGRCGPRPRRRCCSRACAASTSLCSCPIRPWASAACCAWARATTCSPWSLRPSTCAVPPRPGCCTGSKASTPAGWRPKAGAKPPTPTSTPATTPFGCGPRAPHLRRARRWAWWWPRPGTAPGGLGPWWPVVCCWQGGWPTACAWASCWPWNGCATALPATCTTIWARR